MPKHLLDSTRVNPKTGCWEWQRYRDANGYGKVGRDYKVYLAHRVSYEIFIGKIPKRLDLDHLCRNTCCINPAHLEAVTRSVNLKRGVGGAIARARQRAKKHCPQGHPYKGYNLILYNGDWRACRACLNERGRRWYRRKVAKNAT